MFLYRIINIHKEKKKQIIMTKYIFILVLFISACGNSKTAVNQVQATEDKSNKESIFNSFIVALSESDFSKLKPLIVKENEYLNYLQGLSTEKVDVNKLGGSIADLYKFHNSQTERSFNRLVQRIKSKNIDWNKATISNVKWQNDGNNLGQNAHFTIQSSSKEKVTIVAKGMGKVNEEWRLGNTFLIVND